MSKKLLILILLLVAIFMAVTGLILYQEYQYAQSISYYDSLRIH